MFIQRLQDGLADLGDQLRERGQVWALLALAAGVILAGVWLYGQSTPAPVVIRAGSGERASPSEPKTETTIAVHVAGAVRRPGMVSLPSGARINDAVRLVGGPIAGADLDTINLASKLRDGQQIVVPRKGQAASGGAATGGSAAGGGAAGAGAASGGEAKVDLNTATVAQLDSLPGIGPVLAQRIFDHRRERGPFRKVLDLRQVEGIGPKKFDQLRSRVTCGQ